MTITTTATAQLLAELGELGRVIALLYQKVEASDHTATAENRLVQEKLDAWIQTNGSILNSNQELLKLIVLNSQELQRSTASYEKGATLWTSLQPQLTLFEQQMTDWNKASLALAASPLTSEPTNPLHQGGPALNLSLDPVSPRRVHSEGSSAVSNPLQASASRFGLPWLAGTGLGLLMLGGLAMFGLQVWTQPAYRVETPRPLTLEDAALLDWAQSPEGQQARELMRWNSGLLDDRSCEQDVERLGVTLELQGKPARSGFCTLWVVPPEQRRFEPG